MSRGISDYQIMMADRQRMDAYQRAIERVCPGKVVCEIGVGLGPLSLMALNAGAQRVYAIEVGEAQLALSTAVLQANGFGPDRFVPLRGWSTDLQLPERVDVVLSETLDHLGVGEQTVRYMLDARERLLKPDGVFLPAGIGCCTALASPRQWSERDDFWSSDLSAHHGIDYSAIVPHIRSLNYSLDIENEELLSTWCPWQTIDMAHLDGLEPSHSLLFETTRQGRVDGLAFAFVAYLSEDVELSTMPDAPSTHWRQGFQPFPEPIEVEAGDGIYVELQTVDNGPMLGLRTVARRVPRADLDAFIASFANTAPSPPSPPLAPGVRAIGQI